jgi:hypothetical protein
MLFAEFLRPVTVYVTRHTQTPLLINIVPRHQLLLRNWSFLSLDELARALRSIVNGCGKLGVCFVHVSDDLCQELLAAGM